MSLQNNTINLQLILDKINNLPDAGTSGTGEFTVWGKYELAGDAGYSISFGESDSTSATVSSFNDRHKRIIYADYSFDENTGVITLSNPLSTTQSSSADQLSNYQSYPYYYGDNSSGTTDNTVYKLTSVTSSGNSWSKTYTWNFDKAIVTGSTPSAGNFIEYIADRSASAYPDDGVKDGYWYIKVGTGSGSGDADSGTVEITLQTKSATPSETEQTIEPDSGYDGLSKVTVSAISSTYVGSGVTKLGAKTYTPSTSAQTIAANQYLNGVQTISAVPTETKTVRENGTYTPDVGKFFSSITVEVPTNSGNDSEIVEVQGTLPAGLMYGDVNMDGYITEEDSELLESHVLQGGGVITDATALELADLNGDGSISAKDYKALKRIYLQEQQVANYRGDYLGNWSVSDDWSTDFSKRFYVDINMNESTTSKLAVITADADISKNDFKAVCGNGTIRVYAKQLPLNALSVTIHIKEKGTNVFLQEKSITPSESEQIITPDEGYEGFRKVKIHAIPSGGDDSGSGDGLPDVIVAGNTPILASWTGKTVSTNTITDTGLSITIPKNGTYRLYIPATKGSGMGSSGNPTITVYKNGVATDYVVSVTSTTPTTPYSIDVKCAEGDVIGLYATGYKASYSTTSVTVMALIACIDR